MTSSLQQAKSTNKNKEQIALKLKQLKGNAVRDRSFKEFLTRCIAQNIIPMGLKFELEDHRRIIFENERFFPSY